MRLIKQLLCKHLEVKDTEFLQNPLFSTFLSNCRFCNKYLGSYSMDRLIDLSSQQNYMKNIFLGGKGK